jgi:uncharacterized protein YecE (DUF72 family)
MTILVGTASWTDKSLIDCGRFYPADCKTPEARLRHYASLFPLVEVDSSYYAMPSPSTSQLWVERTPPAFIFNVKAFRLFTGHATETKVMHKDIAQALGVGKRLYYRAVPPDVRAELWRRFVEALAPLKHAGKLGMVHFQFPPWLVCNHEGHAHVRHCVEHLPGHVCSIEFRHRSWWTDAARTASTLAFLRELAAVHTIVDGPQGAENSVPAVWETTHPELALVRLHGRNTETYNKPAASAAERFDYDYPDQEMKELVAEAMRLMYKARNTAHIIFNNCDEDKGQRNGLTFLKMLAAYG